MQRQDRKPTKRLQVLYSIAAIMRRTNVQTRRLCGKLWASPTRLTDVCTFRNDRKSDNIGIAPLQYTS